MSADDVKAYKSICSSADMNALPAIINAVHECSQK